MQFTGRRRLSVGCMFTYSAEIPTPAVFMVRPAVAPRDQHRRRPLAYRPAQPRSTSYTDIYGNECVRTVLPAGRSQFGFEAVADVPDATEEADPGRRPRWPLRVCPTSPFFTLPSRYCRPSCSADRGVAADSAASARVERVQAICDHVQQP